MASPNYGAKLQQKNDISKFICELQPKNGKKAKKTKNRKIIWSYAIFFVLLQPKILKHFEQHGTGNAQ